VGGDHGIDPSTGPVRATAATGIVESLNHNDDVDRIDAPSFRYGVNIYNGDHKKVNLNITFCCCCYLFFLVSY
jgi:hypothetical protein